MKVEEEFIPVELIRVLISECDGDHQIVLKEVGGIRQMPVAIGPFEALSINSAVNNQIPPRPMSHDLMAKLINEMGGVIKKIIIDQFAYNEDGVSGTFHAKLVVETSESQHIIDCRPSDAVALAVRLESPLVVAEKVLKSQSVTN